MLFLTYEKNMYHLLREYLLSNGLVEKEAIPSIYNRAMIRRCQELGFTNLEDYSRYVLLQPYHNMLLECKLLILEVRPIKFFQNKHQLDVLNLEEIVKIIDEGERIFEKASKDSWLLDVFTTEITLRKHREKKELYALGVECCAGEEVYSAAIKLVNILSEDIDIFIKAYESIPALIRQAKEAVYDLGKLHLVPDSYRSLYFTKAEGERYRLGDVIKKEIKFIEYNILTQELEEEDAKRYHLVFCNNMAYLYPQKVVHFIIRKLIPYMAKGGLLFVDFKDDFPTFSGLDVVDVGGAKIYKRNDEDCEEVEDVKVSPSVDTIKNRMFLCKALFLDGRLSKAMEYVDDILKEKISNIAANYFKGDVYVKMGEFEKAIKQYENTLIVKSTFLPALFNIAVLHHLNGDEERARSTVEELFKRMPRFDFSILKPIFNIDKDGFLRHCRLLKKIIINDEVLSLDEFLSSISQSMVEKVEIPEVEVHDIFSVQQKKEKKSDSKEDKAKTVVYISELPSTREYKDDPWKKKLQEQQELARIEKAKKKLEKMVEEYKQKVGKSLIPDKIKRRKRDEKN